MKKIYKIAALAVTFASLIFTSCNNLLEDASISGDSIASVSSSEAQGEEFTLSVTSTSDLVNFTDTSSSS